MGFFDLLRKSKNGNKNNSDSSTKIDNSTIDNEAISSLFTAYSKLEDNLGLKITGRSGIIVKSVGIQAFDEMKQYVDNYLSHVSDKPALDWNITYRSLVDKQGYLWFIIKGKEIHDIVVTMSSIADTIHEKGFSRQLLAGIFEFTTGYSVDQSNVVDKENGKENTSTSSNNKSQFLIYNYKLDRFYPFVPLSMRSPSSSLNNELANDHSNKKRNHNLELNIMDQIKDDLPIEKDKSLWYPIWNIPFD